MNKQLTKESTRKLTQNRWETVSAEIELAVQIAESSGTGSKKFGSSAQVASEESLKANANCNW